MDDTIFALSSAHGKAGVAVFRISGKNALQIIEILSAKTILKPRQVKLIKLYSAEHDIIFDEALAIYFIAPHSFTGEDVIELHTHGSIAVTKMLLSILDSIANFRYAEPGEFAKRAFFNNKMDLTSAEGLADLIESETSLQLKQARIQASGQLEKLYSSWRAQLLNIQTLLEAYIDFPDEDIPDYIINDADSTISNLINSIELHLDDNSRGERLRSGIKLSIFGPPNSGKSSLINFLAKRDVAIVSTQAGTTRDIIEIHLDIYGYPIILSDTAGLRKTDEEIEAIGIDKAKQNIITADIKILLLDCSNIPKDLSHIDDMVDNQTIIVMNKIDLIDNRKFTIDKNICYLQTKASNELIKVSVAKQLGFDSLYEAITKHAASLASPSESPVITRLRHRQYLTKALENLLLCKDIGGKDIVLVAEDIRLTARALGEITGRITVDEILGEIFSNFCIGK